MSIFELQNAEKTSVPQYVVPWIWTEEDRKKLNNEFTSFKFGDHYSDDFNIVRVSNGSRYEEYLLPNVKSITTPVPGGNGLYYFDTLYSNRVLRVPIAFDSLSEENFRKFRLWINPGKLQPLIFSETPYKFYMCLVDKAPTLKYICFDEIDANGQKQRVYKGEGAIDFVCYTPFAQSTSKYLDEFQLNGEEIFNNSYQWKDSSNLISTRVSGNIEYDIPKPDSKNSHNFITWVANRGELPTDLRIVLAVRDKRNNRRSDLQRVALGKRGGASAEEVLEFESFSLPPNCDYVLIDSRRQLVEGLDHNFEPIGEIFNNHIKAGNFFQLPCEQNEKTQYFLQITTYNTYLTPCIVDYRYLYY